MKDEKECSKCREIKKFGEFDKNKTKFMGIQSQCKICVSEGNRKYRENNLKKIAEQKKEWRLNNKEKKSQVSKIWYQNNKKSIKTKRKEYYKNNKIKEINTNKKYRQNNKDKINKYLKEKYKNNVVFKLSQTLRNRLRDAIKNNSKSGSAVKDLGCSIQDLKIHLEQQFQKGMSWKNHGSWHIDHIKSLASFDLTNKEELLKACNYTNLQPLWAKDNLSKGCRV